MYGSPGVGQKFKPFDNSEICAGLRGCEDELMIASLNGGLGILSVLVHDTLLLVLAFMYEQTSISLETETFVLFNN